MRKKAIVLVLTALLIAMSLPLSAVAATDEYTLSAEEELLLTIGVGLDYYGTGLKMSADFTYGGNPEPTYYNLALQRLVNGQWEIWTSYSGIRSDNHWYTEAVEQPPRFYTYRVRVTASAPSFPWIEQYSREVFFF